MGGVHWRDFYGRVLVGNGGVDLSQPVQFDERYATCLYREVCEQHFWDGNAPCCVVGYFDNGGFAYLHNINLAQKISKIIQNRHCFGKYCVFADFGAGIRADCKLLLPCDGRIWNYFYDTDDFLREKIA